MILLLTPGLSVLTEERTGPPVSLRGRWKHGHAELGWGGGGPGTPQPALGAIVRVYQETGLPSPTEKELSSQSVGCLGLTLGFLAMGATYGYGF